MMKQLLDFYKDDGPEVCGLILKDNTVVVCENASPNTQEGFAISTDDLIRYEEDMIACWHTHPNESNNLSVEDYIGIKNWPNIKHYIVGNDGVRCYQYRDEQVMVVDV